MYVLYFQNKHLINVLQGNNEQHLADEKKNKKYYVLHFKNKHLVNVLQANNEEHLADAKLYVYIYIYIYIYIIHIYMTYMTLSCMNINK